MKKILIIIMCLFMLVGCKKENINNDNSTTTTTTTKKAISNGVDLDINKALYDLGVSIYNKKEYTKYPKVDGKYYISLSKLISDYGFDGSKIISPTTKKQCDHGKTGIYFDIDNVDKREYKEYPIVLSVYCE